VRQTYCAALQWFERLLNDQVAELLKTDPTWRRIYQRNYQSVQHGEMAPPAAAMACLDPLKQALSSTQ
jgi:hypothetical protein